MNNKLIITGYLEAEPQIWETETLKCAYCSVIPANNKGPSLPNPCNVVIYNDFLVDKFVKHLQKGMHLQLEGRVRNKWVQENGVEVAVPEIVIDNFYGEIGILTSSSKKTPISNKIKAA